MQDMSESPTSSEEFVIHCNDNISVTVSSSQAKKLQANCEYFRSVFDHGTVESKSRTIVKEDWSSTTVHQLIDMITEESFAGVSKSLEEFRQLSMAADQVPFDTLLLSPFTSNIMSKEQTIKFTELSNSINFVFSVEMVEEPLESYWEQLLENGILLSIDWDSLVAVGTTVGREMKQYKWFEHSMGTRFNVYATDPCHALQTLFPTVDRSNDDSDDFNPLFWLSMPIERKVLDLIEEAVSKMTGLELLRSSFCWGREDWWELLTPSVKMLAKVLEEIQKYIGENRILLKVSNQEGDGDRGCIETLLNASLDCKDDKGTICYLKKEGEFRAMKTIRDMTILLERLARTTSSTKRLKPGISIRCFTNQANMERYSSECVDHRTSRHFV